MNTEKKSLFLTDVEPKLEPIIQQEIKIEPENMLMIHSYGPVISHPYGDIMRSIIMAIYKEEVKEIYIVGSENKKNNSINLKNLLDTENQQLENKLQTVDYLFQNCMPEFIDNSLNEWLEEGSEDVMESIQRNVNLIRQHPLIPPYVKVHGLIVKNEEKLSFVD